jgi:hypothetical protein
MTPGQCGGRAMTRGHTLWCRELWARSHAAGPDLVSTRRQVHILRGHDTMCLLHPYPVGGQRLGAFTFTGPCGASESSLIRYAPELAS